MRLRSSLIAILVAHVLTFGLVPTVGAASAQMGAQGTSADAAARAKAAQAKAARAKAAQANAARTKAAQSKAARAKAAQSKAARTKAGRSAAAQHGKHHAADTHHHAKGRSDAEFPADAESTPAYRYAQLDAAGCYDELAKRELPAKPEGKNWAGITAPMRFTGPMNGVTFRTDIPESERSTSPYELFDCRLILALDDFTKLLRAEGIDQVVLSSAYRPPPASAVPVDEQAKRHGGGLAVDIHRFRHEDGHWIKVEQDFHGRIGARVCGATAVAPVPFTEEATLLRRLVCGAETQRLFQSILTPNYDTPHRNHLHLELTAGVKWFIVS